MKDIFNQIANIWAVIDVKAWQYITVHYMTVHVCHLPHVKMQCVALFSETCAKASRQ